MTIVPVSEDNPDIIDSALVADSCIRLDEEKVTSSAYWLKMLVDAEESKLFLYSVHVIYTQTVEPEDVLHLQTK